MNIHEFVEWWEIFTWESWYEYSWVWGMVGVVIAAVFPSDIDKAHQAYDDDAHSTAHCYSHYSSRVCHDCQCKHKET